MVESSEDKLNQDLDMVETSGNKLNRDMVEVFEDKLNRDTCHGGIF